jgi:hypothetical protein
MEITDSKATKDIIAQPAIERDTSDYNGFQELVKSLIPKRQNNLISEEDLFVGVTANEIKQQFGEESYQKFVSMIDLTGNLESEAKDGLNSLVEADIMTSAEADKIYTIAFNSAQIDNETQFLYDHIAGAGDPTKAVGDIDEVLERAYLALNEVSTLSAFKSFKESTPTKAEIIAKLNNSITTDFNPTPTNSDVSSNDEMIDLKLDY